MSVFTVLVAKRLLIEDFIKILSGDWFINKILFFYAKTFTSGSLNNRLEALHLLLRILPWIESRDLLFKQRTARHLLLDLCLHELL